MSAYIKFSQAKRGEIQAANPGAGFGELGKLIGAEWQKLSPAEKASYGAASAPGKTRKTRSNKGGHHTRRQQETQTTRKTRSNKGGHHVRRTQEMHNGLPVYTKENVMKPKKNNSSKGKRRTNPYANFVKAHWAEMKAKNPGGSLSDISKQIAALWKSQK